METRYIDPHDRMIFLGKVGENRARRIVFNIEAWMNTYGEGGGVQLLLKRSGDESPYPAVISLDGGTAEWVITEADVEKPGKGLAELQYHLNGAVVKSKTFETAVDVSLGGTDGEVPEPEKAWVDKVLQAAEDILAAGGGGGGNADLGIDETLIYKDGKLAVNTTADAEADNTLPITSAGVYTIVGNIAAILDTI